MRVALVTPYYFPRVRGNSITVDRIANGLRGGGVDVGIFDLSTLSQGKLVDEVSSFKPDIVHSFHLVKSAPAMAKLATKHSFQLVMTATGTDVIDPRLDEHIQSFTQSNVCFTVFHPVMAAPLIERFLQLKDRIHVIPQSVVGNFSAISPPCVFEGDSYDFRGEHGLRRDDFIFLLPAGLREVKNPDFAIPLLQKVREGHPNLAFVILGEELDDSTSSRVKQKIADKPWAHHIKLVSPSCMKAVYESGDVILNTSSSEGMSNAVQEAMAYGRPILASNIEGNRSLLEQDRTGLLFSNDREFLESARWLITDGGLRKRLGEAAKTEFEQNFPPEKETQRYLDLYNWLLRTDRSSPPITRLNPEDIQ
ncbi:MAG: glycosyltransferase [Candidatus Altiarchaeota archaeon]